MKPGDTLPSVRELALRLHGHRNTVSKAYADPSLDTLLEKIPGRRVTVRQNHATDSSRPDLDAVVNATIQSAHQHGTYRLLRPKHRSSQVIHHQLVSSECLDEIGTTMADSVRPCTRLLVMGALRVMSEKEIWRCTSCGYSQDRT